MNSRFTFRRSYRGPIQALIFDWAGTTVDYGSSAPAAVFLHVFERARVQITQEQARGPMGMAKRDHIREILRLSSVTSAWKTQYGVDWTESDVDALYADFIPLQKAVLADHADPIPGVIEAMKRFRSQGWRIGSTTGYNREMMEILAPEAARRGFQPDNWVCASDVIAARPEPWMALRSAEQLRAFPLESCVKIGDTKADIEEGLNAGMWTVGIAATGNEMGLSLREVMTLDRTRQTFLMERARASLTAVGAHYVVDSVADCDVVFAEIEERLKNGDRP